MLFKSAQNQPQVTGKRATKTCNLFCNNAAKGFTGKAWMRETTASMVHNRLLDSSPHDQETKPDFHGEISYVVLWNLTDNQNFLVGARGADYHS